MKQLMRSELDYAGIAAAEMLYNPCGAELVPTVYPGDQGYMARFNSRFAGGNGAGETCNVLAFKPGNNLTWNASGVASTTSVIPSWVDTQAPGAAFLNTNATKCRAAGACTIIQPIAAPNTATGVIYFGVVPASAIGTTGRTFDDWARLCTESVNISQALMQPLEVKWSPGSFDDRWSPTTGIQGDDDTDRNVILVVTIGLPAATGVNFRLTAIYEWAPDITISVPYDATNTKPSKCDLSCILRNLKRKSPTWWFNLGIKAITTARDATLAYYAGGPMGLVSTASKLF